MNLLEPSDGNSAWKPLLVPFAPTKVLDANGDNVAQFIDKDGEVRPASGTSWLRSRQMTPTPRTSSLPPTASRPILLVSQPFTRTARPEWICVSLLRERPGCCSRLPTTCVRGRTGFQSCRFLYGSARFPPRPPIRSNAGGTSASWAEALREALNEAFRSGCRSHTQVAPFSVYVDAPCRDGTRFRVSTFLTSTEISA